MPGIVREAAVSWEGNLARGTGAITAASSGAFVDLPFSIAARIAVAPDQTSPEELLPPPMVAVSRRHSRGS